MSYEEECQIESPPKRKILILAPSADFEALGALCTAYTTMGIEVTHVSYENGFPKGEEWKKDTPNMDAVLMVAPFRRAPKTLLDGPLLQRSDGVKIPIGLLTPRRPEELHVFAQAAAKVHLQKKETTSLALLSQRHPRYKKLGERIEHILNVESNAISVFNWSSDLVFREDMIAGLGAGLGAALYLGHGRPVGWSGYAGLRAHHFPEKTKVPLGALLSLCCLTASRRKVGRSFSEEMVLSGRAASCLAAVVPTLHTDNTRWAVRIVQSMSQGVSSIGELVTSILPMKDTALNAYRIIGDPFAPLLAPKSGVHFAKKIKTYA